jgi:hypothetical protein
LESELGNLNVTLKELNGELEAFRSAEREKQEEERKKDLPDKQWEILWCLSPQSESNWLKTREVATAVKVPVDEAEVYLDGLKKLGLAFWHSHDPGGGGWLRTMEGSRMVVAKRWAGEEEAEQRDPDRFGAPLTQSQRLVVLYVAKSNGVTAEELAEQLEKEIPTLGSRIWTPQSVLFLLITLREKQMVIDQPAPSSQIPRKWIARRKGIEYLAESEDPAPQQGQCKHADLMPIQHQALLLIARNPQGHQRERNRGESYRSRRLHGAWCPAVLDHPPN